MGREKISLYDFSVGPEQSAAIEPITFDPPLESWACSVALTQILTVGGPTDWEEERLRAPAQILNVDARVSFNGGVEGVHHGTSEEYGPLRSIDFFVAAEVSIEVGALLTMYEFEKEYTRIERPPIDPGIFER